LGGGVLVGCAGGWFGVWGWGVGWVLFVGGVCWLVWWACLVRGGGGGGGVGLSCVGLAFLFGGYWVVVVGVGGVCGCGGWFVWVGGFGGCGAGGVLGLCFCGVCGVGVWGLGCCWYWGFCLGCFGGAGVGGCLSPTSLYFCFFVFFLFLFFFFFFFFVFYLSFFLSL